MLWDELDYSNSARQSVDYADECKAADGTSATIITLAAGDRHSTSILGLHA